MTVNELAKELSLKPLAVPDGEREVTGGYVGDLLSWVMGRARAGQAWITIMSNINILAVAALADVSCILLAEGVLPEEEVRRTAEEKGINLFSAEGTAFQIAAALSGALT